MTFDPKAMAKYPAFATAGGFVLGLGVFKVLEGTVESIIRPLFHVIKSTGTIDLGGGIYIGFASFIGACIIGAASVVVGFTMIKMAGK